MARHVRFFESLWLDRHFKKSLKSLPAPEQERRLREIELQRVIEGKDRPPILPSPAAEPPQRAEAR